MRTPPPSTKHIIQRCDSFKRKKKSIAQKLCSRNPLLAFNKDHLTEQAAKAHAPTCTLGSCDLASSSTPSSMQNHINVHHPQFNDSHPSCHVERPPFNSALHTTQTFGYVQPTDNFAQMPEYSGQYLRVYPQSPDRDSFQPHGDFLYAPEISEMAAPPEKNYVVIPRIENRSVSSIATAPKSSRAYKQAEAEHRTRFKNMEAKAKTTAPRRDHHTEKPDIIISANGAWRTKFGTHTPEVNFYSFGVHGSRMEMHAGDMIRDGNVPHYFYSTVANSDKADYNYKLYPSEESRWNNTNPNIILVTPTKNILASDLLKELQRDFPEAKTIWGTHCRLESGHPFHDYKYYVDGPLRRPRT